LAEIDRLPPTHARFRVKQSVLIESVERHMEEEEHTVFPELRRAVGRKRLSELGSELEAAQKVAPTKPHPHLPDEPPLLPLVGAAAGWWTWHRARARPRFDASRRWSRAGCLGHRSPPCALLIGVFRAPREG
jgi:hypothetical protein